MYIIDRVYGNTFIVETFIKLPYRYFQILSVIKFNSSIDYIVLQYHNALQFKDDSRLIYCLPLCSISLVIEEYRSLI